MMFFQNGLRFSKMVYAYSLWLLTSSNFYRLVDGFPAENVLIWGAPMGAHLVTMLFAKSVIVYLNYLIFIIVIFIYFKHVYKFCIDVWRLSIVTYNWTF